MDINGKSNSLQTAIVLFFLVFTSFENGVLGQCLKNPVNKAVKEGARDVLLSCTPNPIQVEWWCHSISDELDEALVNDAKGILVASARQAFALLQSGLSINEATIYEKNYAFATAGIYVGELENRTRLIGAKLVVVRDGPVCTFDSSSPSNGDLVRMNCTTTYADHSIHPIRPFMTVTVGGQVIAAETLETSRINQYVFVGWLSVRFPYNACASIVVVLTFNPPTDLQYKFIATNAPAFSNSVTFPATSEDCLRYPGNIAVRAGATNVMMYSTRNPMTVRRRVSPTTDALNFYPISDFDKGILPNVSQLYGANKSGLIVFVATAEAGRNPFATAGLYTETYRNKDTRGAKLVVVSAAPTCSSSPGSGGSNDLRCTIEYADHTIRAINPYISFKRNGVVLATFKPGRTIKNDHILTATASYSVRNDASAVDECVFGFNPPAEDSKYSYIASNAPDYTDSCNF